MLYDFDIDIIIPNLVAPVKRLPKYLGYLKALTTPLQQSWEILFSDYKSNSNYSLFDVSTTYKIGERVIWTDKCVYEASYVNPSGFAETFNGVFPSNTLFWTKINSVFIGTDERIKYSAQKLLFEYALNRFFMVSSIPADQIYIVNNFIGAGSNFLMNTSSVQNSVMPINSLYQQD